MATDKLAETQGNNIIAADVVDGKLILKRYDDTELHVDSGDLYGEAVYTIDSTVVSDAAAGKPGRLTYNPASDASASLNATGIERLVIKHWPQRTVQPANWQANTSYAANALIVSPSVPFIWVAGGALTSGATAPAFSTVPITAKGYTFASNTSKIADGANFWYLKSAGNKLFPDLNFTGMDKNLGKPFSIHVSAGIAGCIRFPFMQNTAAVEAVYGGLFSNLGITTMSSFNQRIPLKQSLSVGGSASGFVGLWFGANPSLLPTAVDPMYFS